MLLLKILIYNNFMQKKADYNKNYQEKKVLLNLFTF